MFSASAILITVAIYLAMLVWVGYQADRQRAETKGRRFQSLRYGLSLATLCSAWTYFGGVGDASTGSWLYVANAMGPIIAITVGYPIWHRIALLSKQENVGSLADFLAARYGRSRALGILTTCVACLGALPYISLQLAVLTRVWAFSAHTGAPGAKEALGLIALLALIAILFGARRPSLTQQNRGFVSMIALESCVKLIGLLAVAAVSIAIFTRTPGGWTLALKALPPAPSPTDISFVTLVLLCTVTAFTLPRQFHLGFVTLERLPDIRAAVWVLPAYFALWVLATMAASLAIRAGFGIAGEDPYLQVLAVPMLHGGKIAAMLTLLGGVSAGAAMVVVETTAISAMVSNEIVLPLFSRVMPGRLSDDRLGRLILRVRRGTILAIAVLAWLYYVGIGGSEAPTELGLTALTAFAQLLPALVGGIFWRRGHVHGAMAGIGAGILVWAATIAGPLFFPVGPASPHGGDVLWGPLPRLAPMLAIYASLAINILLYVVISIRSKPGLIDRIQADSFVSKVAEASVTASGQIRATAGDLRNLLAQFLGPVEADKALLNLSLGTRGGALPDDREVGPNLVRAAERVLAGVIGTPSARNVVAIALSAGSQDAREISRILDETAHAVHFSRELLRTTLDSLPEGISVVDREIRLIAWNTRFLELMELKPSEVYVGKALIDLGAASLPAGASGVVRDRVISRLSGSTRPLGLEEEIPAPGGRRLRITGRPLLEGDYLTILKDVTDIRRAESVLERSKEELELLVGARTGELQRANEALSAAKQVAEQASGAQRRFVAAASHDLVQPLHAARLFVGNALTGLEHDPTRTSLLQRADQAVDAAHCLLRALLNLSQLETGVLHPKLDSVDAGALLGSLAQEFAPQAELRGLDLVLLPTAAWVRSDRDLLRSMLQNLVLNALRYTAHGRVVIAVRRAGEKVRFEVRDTGVGIAPELLPAAFGEYSRLSEGSSMSEGAGLGLSIVARIAQRLGHEVAVRSRPGMGSVFSVTVSSAPPVRRVVRDAIQPVLLNGLKVLCVDDERDVLLGTAALIERWGGKVAAFDSAAAAMAAEGHWDVILADFQLGVGNGLELLRALKGRARLLLLVTASPEAFSLPDLAADGIVLMAKPLAPLALQAVLAEAAGHPQEEEDESRFRPTASN